MPRGDECQQEAKLLQEMMWDLGFEGQTGKNWEGRELEQKKIALLLMVVNGG